jgi:hypothetical protein
MLVKKVVKAALYTGILGAFALGCGTFGVVGGVDEEDGLQSWNGLLAPMPGLSRHSGSLPEGSSDLISDLSMGSVVISGGSATIAIRSNSSLSRLYIKFSNESVYYELVLTDDDYLGVVNGVYLYTPVIYISQQSASLVNNGTVRVYLAVESTNNQRSRAEDRQIVTQVVGSGSLQLALTWNTTSDVDLHVILPDGKHAYYNNKLIKNTNGDTLAHLDKDANVNCGNVSNENMYFRTLLNGYYLVYVRLYTNCSRSGASFTVTATAGGQILDNRYLDDTRGSFPATAADYDDYIIGVITVENGRVVPTNYNSPAVESLLLSSSLPKRLAIDEKK